MSQEERELDQLVKDLEEETFRGVPPVFELAITTFSLALTITLFIYPDMLEKDYKGYSVMLVIMPYYLWGIFFFIASLLKGVGLLVDFKLARIMGLVLSSVLYITMGLSFASDFPSISSIQFTVIAIFSIVSLTQVKHTSIINRGHSDEQQDRD